MGLPFYFATLSTKALPVHERLYSNRRLLTRTNWLDSLPAFEQELEVISDNFKSLEYSIASSRADRKQFQSIICALYTIRMEIPAFLDSETEICEQHRPYHLSIFLVTKKLAGAS